MGQWSRLTAEFYAVVQAWGSNNIAAIVWPLQQERSVFFCLQHILHRIRQSSTVRNGDQAEVTCKDWVVMNLIMKLVSSLSKCSS